MSRKNKGSKTVANATVTKRSEAPQINAEAVEALTQQVAKQDASPLKRDYADKSAYRQGTPAPRILSTVEEPAKYVVPPKLAPLNSAAAHKEDIRVALMGIFSFATFVAGMVIGKVLP